MAKKLFSFHHPRFKQNSLDRQRFYKSNYDKPISEEDFVKAVTGWPKPKDKNSKQLRGRRPNGARREYRHLVETFGFFQPGAAVEPRSLSNEEITGKKAL